MWTRPVCLRRDTGDGPGRSGQHRVGNLQLLPFNVVSFCCFLQEPGIKCSGAYFLEGVSFSTPAQPVSLY